MKISDIIIGDRVRRSEGWLDDLERSIEKMGVLQPVGVTPENVLIFGFRRLMACKNLGMTEIPARVIDVGSEDPSMALRMEQSENNIRQDFTPSEKVEISRRIEEAMGNRQGQRSELTQRVGGVPLPKGESADIAAEAVGWSGEQYRRAKTVVEQSDENTVRQMDEGKISVREAYRRTTGKQDSLKIILRMNVKSDAKEILRFGGDYADALLAEIAKLRGHELEMQRTA